MLDINHYLASGRKLMRSFAAPLSYIARHYAAVLFCDSTALGFVLLAITFTVPNIGGAGLLAVLSAYLFASRFYFICPIKNASRESSPASGGQAQEPFLYNSLLLGLSLGSLYQLNAQLVLLIIIGAVFTVLLTQFLANALWRLGQLPVLSMPFVLMTWTLWLAAKSISGLQAFTFTTSQDILSLPWWSGVFKTLGLFFFIPHPWLGLLMLLGIAWVSRYLAMLALAGYLSGYLTMLFVFGHPEYSQYIGFNFMLVAMAIGGVFTVPSKASFWLAVFGAALSAIIAESLGRITLTYGLPVLTMPFVLSSLIIVAGLSRRNKLAEPYLLLEQPDLPEVSYERMRLITARCGEIGSVPLFAPFLGQWQVYQSFNGPHTHQAPWQHALDFFMLEDQQSFRNDGLKLEDYYCFGSSVVAPAPGQVVACRDDLPDNPPGEVDTIRNWGNYIQIRIAGGQLVLLAHLRQHSLLIKEGDWVASGQCLASCGNSGRSPQPHLHMHLQTALALGSATVPFHLCSVITREQPQAPAIFHIATRPDDLVSVAPALRDDKLAAQLRFPVGRCLYFRFRNAADGDWEQRSFKVELTLLGQFRLLSETGASVAFEESSGLLAFYDRQGGEDILLDMWILALGLTPLTSSAAQWQDKPSPRLFPLRRWQSLLFKLRPLAAGLNSCYQRCWDSRSASWLQQGHHELQLFPGMSLQASTQSNLSPQAGITSLSMQAAGQQWQAELAATGLSADHGVPAWVASQPVEVASQTLNVDEAADWIL